MPPLCDQIKQPIKAELSANTPRATWRERETLDSLRGGASGGASGGWGGGWRLPYYSQTNKPEAVWLVWLWPRMNVVASKRFLSYLCYLLLRNVIFSHEAFASISNDLLTIGIYMQTQNVSLLFKDNIKHYAQSLSTGGRVYSVGPTSLTLRHTRQTILLAFKYVNRNLNLWTSSRGLGLKWFFSQVW